MAYNGNGEYAEDDYSVTNINVETIECLENMNYATYNYTFEEEGEDLSPSGVEIDFDKIRQEKKIQEQQNKMSFLELLQEKETKLTRQIEREKKLRDMVDGRNPSILRRWLCCYW